MDQIGMPAQLSQLVKAVLSRVREREGYVNKTKLVKYLYLLDLEYYRQTHRLLTGFSWRFHLYGPWADEFETFYQSLRDHGDIKVQPGTKADLDTEFVSTDEYVDPQPVVGDFATEFRRIVDQWADRRLGEMLDYVYFYTEPMHEAVRGAPLDFGRVEVDRRSYEIPAALPPDPKVLNRIRRQIAERKPALELPASRHFTAPPYDRHYFEALRRMDEDEGY